MNPRRKKWLQSSERKDKKEGELDFFFFFLHGERSLDLDISLDVQIESALESIQDYSCPKSKKSKQLFKKWTIWLLGFRIYWKLKFSSSKGPFIFEAL